MAVEYGGTAKSFVLALWLALAGISTAALDAFGYLVGLAGVWTSILLARRILPPGAALFAGLVLAVPSLHAVTWALGGNLMYPATFLLGNLILLLTHAIFFRSPDRPGLVLVAGLLSGIGWWTNPLIVVYCVPFALLAVRTGLVWRATVWLFPLRAGSLAERPWSLNRTMVAGAMVRGCRSSCRRTTRRADCRARCRG